MPWSGPTFTRTNGTYSGASVWASDLAANIKIVASRHDTHDQDIATGINACLNKNGQNSPTANINWGGFKITNLATGTVATDAIRYDQLYGAFQPIAAVLTSIDGAGIIANQGFYGTAPDNVDVYSLTAGGRALGGVAGTADTFAYFSASNTASLAAITAAGRAMAAAANAAAQVALLPIPYDIVVAISDESTAITTGTAKVTIRAPRAMTLSTVLASLNTVSSSGTPTFDINVNGATILSTKLTIDVSEKTSTTAAVPVVISNTAIAFDDEITFDIDVAGTGAKGAKIVLKGTTP